ncbi:hypothetical protein C8Q76DRAFT_782288 [Earliella scabrosa]|nr:hypothetical protein C8Q76DRAFT_782288 [Earliella scabrosa]
MDYSALTNMLPSKASSRSARTQRLLTSAVSFYEYLITLGPEVGLFWMQKPTGACVLFMLNRYIFLLNNVLGALYWAPQSERMYALLPSRSSGRRSTNMEPPPQSPVCSIFLGQMCVLPLSEDGTRSSNDSLPVNVVTRTSVISAEVLVILVTWFTTYRRGIFRQRGLTLSSIVLFDGTIYFLAMLILNVIDMCFSLLTIGPTTAIRFSSLVADFVEPINSVLISRFLLKLQAASHDTIHLDSGTQESSQGASGVGVGTLNFARIIGSLGSSLDPEEDGGSRSSSVEKEPDLEATTHKRRNRRRQSCEHEDAHAAALERCRVADW